MGFFSGGRPRTQQIEDVSSGDVWAYTIKSVGLGVMGAFAAYLLGKSVGRDEAKKQVAGLAAARPPNQPYPDSYAPGSAYAQRPIEPAVMPPAPQPAPAPAVNTNPIPGYAQDEDINPNDYGVL